MRKKLVCLIFLAFLPGLSGVAQSAHYYVDSINGSDGDGFDSLEGYKLKDGSPCIGAGLPVKDNGGRDFWGNPLPDVNAPDIGAHQFSN